MVGPPVAGTVYDATQSYDVAFYMAGGFLVVSSLISFAAELKLICQNRSSKSVESPAK
jgi:cyanate permease